MSKHRASPPRQLRLLEKRLLIVCGEGGVGKSTIAAAVALAAARSGQRTLLVEVAGRSDAARLLGGKSQPALTEVELLANVSHVTIDRHAALRDYLEHEVSGPLPVGLLARSRIFSAFVEATPGMGELLTIGKVWELARSRRPPRRGPTYDLVVLDGPAGAQLMALLGAPQMFRNIARMGPVARQAADIERLLRDSGRTGVLAVTTPEREAVSELLGLPRALASQGLPVDAVVINRVVSSPFSVAEDQLLRESGAEDPAVRSARWFSDRAQAQREQMERLGHGLETTIQTNLPLIFAGMDPPAVDEFADRLTREIA